jgi:excisionase family DNA binding protein
MGNFSRRMNRRERRARGAAMARELESATEFGSAGEDYEAHESARRTVSPEVEERVYLATSQEVAQYLRVHVKTVERWRRLYGLPCLKIGGRIRYDVSDVTRWASAHKEVV